MNLLGALFTVLFGGILSGIVSHLLTSSRAARDLKRQKLEALFAASRSHLRAGYSHAALWIPVMNGQPIEGLKEAGEELGAKLLSGESPRDPVLLLVMLYFPDLKVQWGRVETSYRSIMNIQSQFSEARGVGKPGTPFVGPYREALECFRHEHDQFMESLHLQSQALAATWWSRFWEEHG